MSPTTTEQPPDSAHQDKTNNNNNTNTNTNTNINTNINTNSTSNNRFKTPPIASSDVVFVIEATANLGTYFDVLKTHYIIPTIEHFCGYSFSEGNYSGSDFSDTNALFALVAYHTANSAPEPASICIGPTSSPQKILLWIESLKFVGGGAENLGQITEGMASALQIFDDFDFIHKSNSINNKSTRIQLDNNIMNSNISIDKMRKNHSDESNQNEIDAEKTQIQIESAAINNDSNTDDRNGNCDKLSTGKQETSESDPINETESSSSPTTQQTTTSALNARNKHCILICNSLPYQTPCTESPSYFGLGLDSLVNSIRERHISLSIITPRKMSFFLKLFEKAGGDLQSAMSKHYARDSRHLLLLRNYKLVERPISPPCLNPPAPKSIQVTNTSQSSVQVRNQTTLPSDNTLNNNATLNDSDNAFVTINNFGIHQPGSNTITNTSNNNNNNNLTLNNIAGVSITGPNSPASLNRNYTTHQQSQLMQQPQGQQVVNNTQLLNHDQIPNSPASINQIQKNPNSPAAQASPLYTSQQQHPSPMAQVIPTQNLINKQMPSPASNHRGPNSPAQPPQSFTPNQQVIPTQTLMNKQMPSPASNQKGPNSPAQTSQSYPLTPQQQSQSSQQQILSPQSPMISKQMPSPITSQKRPHSPTLTPPQATYSAPSPMAPPTSQQIPVMRQQQMGAPMYHKGPNLMLVPKKDEFDGLKRQLEVPSTQKQKVSLFKGNFDSLEDQNQLSFGNQLGNSGSTIGNIQSQSVQQQMDLVDHHHHHHAQSQQQSTMSEAPNLATGRNMNQMPRNNALHQQHPQSPAQPNPQQPQMSQQQQPLQVQQQQPSPQQQASQQTMQGQQLSQALQQQRIHQQGGQQPMSTFQVISQNVPHQTSLPMHMQQQQQQQSQPRHHHQQQSIQTGQQQMQIAQQQQSQPVQIQQSASGQVIVQQANAPLSMTNLSGNYYQVGIDPVLSLKISLSVKSF